MFAGDASYSTLVRNLLSEEQRYLRDLQLIIKLIKKFFTDRSDLFSEAVGILQQAFDRYK